MLSANGAWDRGADEKARVAFKGKTRVTYFIGCISVNDYHKSNLKWDGMGWEEGMFGMSTRRGVLYNRLGQNGKLCQS